MCPSHEAKRLSEEQSVLVVRDRSSGLVMVYPQTERAIDWSKHPGLETFCRQTVARQEERCFHVGYCAWICRCCKGSRLDCWSVDSEFFALHCDREVRTFKELARPSRAAAGFPKKLWLLSVDYTVKARSFFNFCPILQHERDAEKTELKQIKDQVWGRRWIRFWATTFSIGCALFLQDQGRWNIGSGTKPGLFVGWHLSPGLQYTRKVFSSWIMKRLETDQSCFGFQSRCKQRRSLSLRRSV